MPYGRELGNVHIEVLGRSYLLTGLFPSVDEANAFMSENSGHAIIAACNGGVFVCRKNDKGITTKNKVGTNEKRPMFVVLDGAVFVRSMMKEKRISCIIISSKESQYEKINTNDVLLAICGDLSIYGNKYGVK